ncbi:hypothetical protein ABT095_06860 [Kitasatospora sp. NPDC002227]|uniref:hypothetical protein n=1 Tax=Kitasatospora sp. NPDC002227 TaxID=3154773 RepID=UPI003329ED8F
MKYSSGRSGGTVFALLASVLALAGCSTGRGADTPVPTVAAAAAAGVDPSAWTLPLLAFEPTAEQDRVISQAELKLVAACVRGYGVAWQTEPDLPPHGPKNMLDRRYGIHDLRLAEQRGYQLDAGEESRYNAALQAQSKLPPTPPDTEVLLGGTDIPPEVLAKAGPSARAGVVGGKQIPQGGCYGQARQVLGSATHGISQLVQDLNHQSYPASMQDPKVLAVFAGWSVCMSKQGFSYKAPLEANDDPRFGPDPKGGVSRLQIATATADITCRNSQHVAEVWHHAEVELQQKYIEQHRAALEADRRTLDAVVKKAAEVLARP